MQQSFESLVLLLIPDTQPGLSGMSMWGRKVQIADDIGYFIFRKYSFKI